MNEVRNGLRLPVPTVAIRLGPEILLPALLGSSSRKKHTKLVLFIPYTPQS